MQAGVTSTVNATKDNGVIVTGKSSSEALLVKVSAAGVVEWTRSYGEGGFYYERLVTVKQTSDNHYITVGSTGAYSNGQASVYVLKIAQNGTILWAKS